MGIFCRHKIKYFYPMEWSDMQINYIICIFINTDENFRK